MNVELMINENNDVCIVHDEPFEGIGTLQSFVYDWNSSQVLAVGNTGEVSIGRSLAPEMSDKLIKAKDVLVMRIKDEELTDAAEYALTIRKK